MKGNILLVCLLGVLLASVAYGRVLDSTSPGRRLMTISTTASGADANFTIQAFATSNLGPGDQCIVQGYPGSRADSVVQGPLVVSVPTGTTSQILISQPSNGNFVQLYNQTADFALSTFFNSSNGQLVALRFVANGTVGSSQYATGGLTAAQGAQPACLLNVTFVVTNPSPPPSPPPKLSPPATPRPTPAGVIPRNPCYCTPANNGGTVCFNFNQATSDINCAPAAGLNCQTGTSQAGVYTQQAGPVYFCD